MYENVIGDEEIIMHKIHMPDNIKGGWYWQIRSIDSLHRRLLAEFADNHYFQQTGLHPRFSNHCTILELDDEYFEKSGMERPCYSTVEHDTVWEFYKYIDYDHKKRSVRKFMV